MPCRALPCPVALRSILLPPSRNPLLGHALNRTMPRYRKDRLGWLAPGQYGSAHERPPGLRIRTYALFFVSVCRALSLSPPPSLSLKARTCRAVRTCAASPLLNLAHRPMWSVPFSPCLFLLLYCQEHETSMMYVKALGRERLIQSQPTQASGVHRGSQTVRGLHRLLYLICYDKSIYHPGQKPRPPK
jgi:hypothetical protein